MHADSLRFILSGGSMEAQRIGLSACRTARSAGRKKILISLSINDLSCYHKASAHMLTKLSIQELERLLLNVVHKSISFKKGNKISPVTLKMSFPGMQITGFEILFTCNVAAVVVGYLYILLE